MGGSPNWVIAERSSKRITLHVAPVSNRHAKVVVKSSLADLNKLISASHCFTLVWTGDSFTCEQFSSEPSSSSSLKCRIFFHDKHGDAKWPFFDTCCTFSWTRDTLLFFHESVYDRRIKKSVRKDVRNSSFLISSLNSTIFLHVSSYNDFYCEISCHWIFLKSSFFLSPAPTIVLISCEAISVMHICMAFFKSRDFFFRSLTLSP